MFVVCTLGLKGFSRLIHKLKIKNLGCIILKKDLLIPSKDWLTFKNWLPKSLICVIHCNNNNWRLYMALTLEISLMLYLSLMWTGLINMR